MGIGTTVGLIGALGTKTQKELDTVKSALQAIAISPEKFGAKGDGVTDDSQAVQDAVDAGYNIRFDDNKTYYLESTVTINHDCHLFGGKNTVIKTKTPDGGVVNDAILVEGTLKKTTTLTTDYSSTGNEGCAGNRLQFSDMTGINIGDIVEIEATDQYYSYNRAYYYLGAVLLVVDKDDDYIYVSDAMPWDIENTENVTVKIYSAPTVLIENLGFVSDVENPGHYKYCIKLEHCKNSTVKDCTISNADNGLAIRKCVNTLVDNVFIYGMPEREAGSNLDHYGVFIYSSTNTTVIRIISECANSSVDLSGQIPNLNTRIRECNLFSSNKTNGLGMHENTYNAVVEDCVLGGVTAYGTVIFNRCRFIRNNKNENEGDAILFRGSHKKEWARLKVVDCEFYPDASIILKTIETQNPIMAFDNVIESVEILDCIGGRLMFNATTSATVLSNKVEKITIKNWKNCKEIYHTPNNIIDLMLVLDSTFAKKYWLNNHADSFNYDYIRYLKVENAYPQIERIIVNETHGGQYYLPKNIPVNFSSSDTSAQYIVCGENISSDKYTDYCVGNVSGSVGSEINRTKNNSFASSLSENGNGEVVFTHPQNSSANVFIYPVCMMYVKKECKMKTSCKVKNTGNTSGASFKMYIVIIDAKTGLITYRANGSAGQASVDGTVITHTRDIEADSIVMAYLYESTVVQESETTFSEFVTKLMQYEQVEDLVYEPFEGSSRIGDGSLLTVGGWNNFGTNASAAVSVKFNANLLNN